ncbi:MAG TPA: CehA/McbA family metallohydrolase [Gemmatimonadaceae bacterium]|nr:CehA/McbA family metallohydrolase [Gemmatimonadaceae bacterium]
MPLSLAAVVALVLCASPAGAQAASWYRGNTHTHTLNSDGDSPPDSVARWYRDRGYHFLFITDHEKLTDPGPLNQRFGAAGKFLLIAGQEVTQRISDSTHHRSVRQAHVNALGARSVVMPQGERGLARGITMREGYADNVARIRAAGGIPQINHPNFIWSVRLHDLIGLPDSVLLEIANAHTGVNNAGDGDSVPAVEALWDSLLTRGRTVFAVADDDAHSFRPRDADAFELTRPGRGWIMVRADTLTADAILAGIRRGDFYSSTGVALDSLILGPDEIRLSMTPRSDSRFTTEFIGAGGRVLARVRGPHAAYRVRGTEGYIRARITDSNGRRAWTQALKPR